MDFLRDEDVPLRVAVLEAEIVALSDHPDREHADARPRVEPGMERAECMRPRWELDEAEGGGEERAAAVGARESRLTRSPDPPARAALAGL